MEMVNDSEVSSLVATWIIMKSKFYETPNYLMKSKFYAHKIIFFVSHNITSDGLVAYHGHEKKNHSCIA